MKVLDRYVIRSLLSPLAGSIIVFLTLAVVVDLFERLDTFIDHEVPVRTIVQYYVATLPFLIVLMLPVATLIGVLFSLGGMARRNELIAMTANGISLYRILAPTLVVGFVVSAVGFLLTAEIVPRGNGISEEIYDHEIKGRPRLSGTSRRDLNYLGSGGRFFLIRRFDGEAGVMDDVVVQQFAEGTLVHRIDAVRATWQEDRWIFESGFLRRFGEDGLTAIEAFEQRAFPDIEETPRDFLREIKEPKEMTLSELREHRRRTRLSGGDVTKIEVDERMRASFPAASFIVVLLGAPLAGAIRRGGHALGFGLALLVSFVYYVLLQVGETYGHNGTLTPTLAAWLPNLVFLAIGIFGLWKSRK